MITTEVIFKENFKVYATLLGRGESRIQNCIRKKRSKRKYIKFLSINFCYFRTVGCCIIFVFYFLVFFYFSLEKIYLFYTGSNILKFSH